MMTSSSSYYMPLSRRLAEYAASYLSPYIKLDEDDDTCSTADNDGNASSSASKPKNTQSSLSVGLWSGNVELKCVELRPDAIEQFLNADNNNASSDCDVNDSDFGNNYGGAKVRWKLLRGSIDSVSIQIPWKNLLIGSSHSSERSSRRTTLSSLSETDNGDERDVESDFKQIDKNQEEDGATDGYTMINIEGVRLQIGYEIIHDDPLLNALKLQSTFKNNDVDNTNLPRQEEDAGDKPPLDDVQKQIREERNRILRIAERRLLAGLDPFPPHLVAGLQSIIASSIQSAGMKSASDISSSGTSENESRGISYMSRMEAYVSSTIRNIAWRTFDSLSLSITRVQVSIVGCSHYDKDIEATLRKSILERRKQEKVKEHQQQQQLEGGKSAPQQKYDIISRQIFQQRWLSHHDKDPLKTPKMHNLHKRNRHDWPFSPFQRAGRHVPGELEIGGNNAQSVEEEERDDSEEDNAWAREGEIEIGFLLDRFNVRPASSVVENNTVETQSVTSEDSSDSAGIDKGVSALKHFRITNFGVFLRRSTRVSPDDEPSFGNELNGDDYIIDPTNVEASVRLYRSNPEASEMNMTRTTTTNLSPRKSRSGGQSFSVNTEKTSGSIGTNGSKRRGKRDKMPIVRLSQAYYLRKRSRRLEVSVQFGHVRSSVSPRQLFLLDSVCSSMDRMKMGRPSMTIRRAKSCDRQLLAERMTTDGQPIIDWDERIIEAIPSLRSSRKTKRILPAVISSWWRYACINVVKENHQRKLLLDRCRGRDGKMKRRNSIALHFKSRSGWDWEKQTRIRRDYIELYLIVHASLAGNDDTDNSLHVSVTGAAAVEAAKVRLEELEDQLSVERILLLKHVARAASIRKNDFETQSFKSEDSSRNEEYFCFPPNFLENADRVVGSRKLSAVSRRRRSTELTISDSNHSADRDFSGGKNFTIPLAQVDTRRATKSTTRSSEIALSHPQLPRSSKTFFVEVKVSGYSLALCNFEEDEINRGDSSEDQKFNLPDDISALTGYSDVDDSSHGRIKLQQLPDERLPADRYVPNCRFWENSRRGLCYEPILLMHVVNVSVTGQNLDGDHSRVECEFAVGGLELVTCASPSSLQRIISMGQLPTEETINQGISHIPHVKAATGIASFVTGGDIKQTSSVIANVCPTVIMVDWGGFEKVVAFVAESRDVSKGTMLVPFEDESLLRGAFSTKKPQSNLSLTLECDKMSLSAPTSLHRADDAGEQYIIVTVDSFSLKTGNSSVKTDEEGHDRTSPEVPFLNENLIDIGPGKLITLSNLGFYVASGEFHPSGIDNNVALMQYPVNIQCRLISNACKERPCGPKTEITFSPVNVLVSKIRLQVLSNLATTCSSFLMKVSDQAEKVNELSRPTLSAMSDSVLTEIDVSIPSLAISVVHDSETNDNIAYNQFVRNQLEEILASYLSQLSCLDLKHAGKLSSECMTNLCLSRCCAIGIAKDDAQVILDAAKSHFKRDLAVKRSWNKRSLTERMDSVILNASNEALSKFDAMKSIQGEHLGCNFVVRAKSLTINHSRVYLGSLMNCTAAELYVQNENTRLLHITSSNDTGIALERSDVSATISIRISNDECLSTDVYLELDHVDAVYLAEAYIDVIETLKSTTQCIADMKENAKNDPPNDHTTSVKEFRFDWNASSASILLTDNFIPFVRCKFGDISFGKTAGPSDPLSKTTLLAGSVALECVSPFGAETYPNIVTTYDPNETGLGPSALSVQVTSERSSEQTYTSVCFNGVRVLILYQFICEFNNFLSSPDYGFGLLSRYLGNHNDDYNDEDVNEKEEKNSSPSTSKLEILFKDSTIVLPRESTCIDLLGIEVEELSIVPEKVKQTWSVDEYSFSRCSTLDRDDPSSSSSSDGFFDCMEELSGESRSNNSEEGQISRLKVQLRQARIFTALNKHCKQASKVHMPLWNARVIQTGRIQSEKIVFRACGDVDGSIASEIQSRAWEEITTEPLSLSLTIDWAPTLRLLIESTSIDEFSGVAFDMRMSQFYLLMGIWYNNMQELPLMFPYKDEVVRVLSADPRPPLDWPEYGTNEFIERIKHGSASNRFEMALCVSTLKWRCSFDQANYFGEGIDPPMFLIMQNSTGSSDQNAIDLKLENSICSIKKNEDMLLSIGLAATSLEIFDRRCKQGDLLQSLGTKNRHPRETVIDHNWGLDCGRHTLVDGLPLPVQATVFITPDYYCMINLGLDMAEAALADLGVIWILHDYFGLYFKEPAYGHPAFVAEKMIEDHSMNITQAPCLSIDFRLWLADPHVVIPSSSNADATSCLMLEGAGLQYRYKSFGFHFSSQDIVAKDLGIVVLSKYVQPDLSRGIRQVSGSLLSCGSKTLVDGLSASVKYDYDDSTKFTRFSVLAPLSPQHFNRNSMDGIEPSEIDVKPFLVPPPLVCNPLVTPSRNLGNHETKVYFSYEYMKLAADLLVAFTGPNPNQGDEESHGQMEETNDNSSLENIFSITADLGSIKFIVSDPIMGMHRPFFSVSISSILLTVSKLKEIEQARKKYDKFLGRGSTIISPSTLGAKDLQASMEAVIFVDYFKLGITRNWEPLIEPFRCLTMYEQSTARGKGITFNASCPLHLNITGASIETIDDAIGSFSLDNSEDSSKSSPKGNRSQEIVAQIVTKDESGHKLTVLHKIPESLNEQERVAFSLKNLSGQRIRVHTQSDLEAELSSSKTTVMYLDHSQLMPVSFPATETVVKNLEPVEVPFEGDQNITSQSQHKQFTVSRNHSVDVQVPGFLWARGISLDRMGKHFVELVPRSPSVRVKTKADWRLQNALHMLAEVNSVNGGRRLSIMSPFEVVNKTDHSICVTIHPDPRHLPESEEGNDLEHGSAVKSSVVEKLDPDGSYNIPHLLLESALHLEGSHLGSIWIKPDQSSYDEGVDNISYASKDCNFKLSSNTDTITYPPRPVQLAKILHETSLIFRDTDGDPNQVASGAEISLPILDKNNKRKTIPFCYVVEVKRSPLVSSESTSEDEVANASPLSPPMTGKGLRGTRMNFLSSRGANQARVTMHAPVVYSLVIHPPIVIENLLPERGRFELMNATSRAVLWWGNLEPGERFPIHTVGLDAPLMLLVNLGFCRTPVGEGALIHDGGEDGFWLKTGWKTVGNAIFDTQDKVKKTLTAITKSKDNRGVERVTKLRQKKTTTGVLNQQRVSRRTSTTNALGHDVENDEPMDKNVLTTGMAKLRDTYSAEDIATETIVVDSVGQRLTLMIDNVLGNGGQRQVTIYSPFWIVNTTEHSLRYKQEKAMSYVSGTVLGPEKDGSKPVDGSNRNDADDDNIKVGHTGSVAGFDSLQLNTIFPGTPGVLKELEKLGNIPSKPAILAALISEDLPLSITSKLAIMFNFQEVLSLSGTPRLCIQLADATNPSQYTSAWSSGFGLESVGVTQIVGMICKDGRGLEVSVSISVAPGRLSNYTKIVRICPRYVVVNQLSHSVRLWQDNSLLHPNQVAERSDVAFESRKWIFADGNDPGVIRQYEPLFGAPTVIDINEESGIPSETSAHHNACYIATIRPSELTAFHLPDTRLERLLRVELGFGWNLSSSFPADTAGQYVLSMDRARDVQTLPHVSTRAAPIFNVVLPPPDAKWNGELGIWFETDWGRDRSLIVKGTKDESFASYFTDIVVGDELVLIDDVPVTQFTFDEAMKHLKARLSYAQELIGGEPAPPQQHRLSLQRKKKAKKVKLGGSVTKESVTLTFMTLEERMRRLRQQSKGSTGLEHISAGEGSMVPGRSGLELLPQGSSKDLFVDMNFLYQTMFLSLRGPDPTDTPHKIINRSSRWNIYYRQRACDSHPWKCLSPGESAPYTWEEPLKSKKLSVRVGAGEWSETMFGKDNRSSTGTVEMRQKKPLFSFHFVENEEQGHFGAIKTVKLEEIGYMDRLPYPAKGEGGKNVTDGIDFGLHCHVDTEGAIRVLIVSDEATQSLRGDESLIVRHLTNIKRELREEQKRKSQLDDINRAFNSQTVESGEGSDFMSDTVTSSLGDTTVNVVSQLNEIVDYDEDMFITKCNQVIVEVLEATGLQSANLNGLSNPYCQVSLIEGRKKMRSFSFGSKVQSRSTYYVEKTVSPQWSRQVFVFDVPSKAAHDPRETRRFSIHCVVKSEEKIVSNKFLGQAYVHLRNLEDQQECIGWYPLMGKVGKNEDSVDRIRGAIRLRVQWIFDLPGLLNYYSLCSDRRIETLTKSKAGMKRQLKVLKDDEKQRKEVGESLSLTKVPALAATMYRKKKAQLNEPDSDGRPSQDGQSNMRIGMKGIVVATTVLAKLRLSKQDQGQNNRSDSFVDALDEIKEEYASEYDSDDSFDSLQQNLSPGAPTTPLKEPIDGIKEDGNDGLLDATTVHAQISPFKSQVTSQRARFEYLRKSNWEHKNVVKSAGAPLFTSINLSRAFVNARNTTPIETKPFKMTSPLLRDDDEDVGDKFLHIIDHLRLPSTAPSALCKRGNDHVKELMHSRTSFSKAARRSLGSVLNPGGVLTIRPITALNLPETYTGMFVKLRYGNTILCTNIVDSKVVPVWSDEETPDSMGSTNIRTEEMVRKTFVKQRSYSQSTNDLNQIAELFTPTRFWGVPKQNDLVLNVDPFETSKSLRLTVIGEKLQSKEEIGVLDIPLGRALECCSQSMEDFQESLSDGDPWDRTPAYVRWFPLMSSALAVPLEGDMGQSTRPPESEQVNDNMFEEYFAPCIKLALLFQPNHNQQVDSDVDDATHTDVSSTDQYICARLDRISAAVIDSSRCNELFSLSTRDVDVRRSVTKAKTRTLLSVGNVQIDQQSSSFRCKAPVIFAPSPTKHPHPTVQFLCWKDNVRSKNDIQSYDYVALQLQEMDLMIEETWLFEVWEFYFHVMKKRELRLLSREKIVPTKASRGFTFDDDSEKVIEDATAFLQVDRESKMLKKIYVRELILGYTKINLSYFKSPKGNLVNSDTLEDTPLSFQNEVGLDAFRHWSEEIDGGLDDFTHFARVNMISAVFPSISDAPIRFQGKLIEHVYEFEGDISKYLQSFYAAEALKQIYKIVGSLDFVGNPTMVVSSFSTGLRDFVLQPSRELKHLTKNPSRFGVGVMRGTLSLVSNTASGVFGFFSNVGSTVGHTAAALTLDKEFQKLHSEQQAAQQKNYDRWRKRGFGRVTLLVTRPIHDVVFGLVSASTGVLTEPYKGAKQDGVTGFAKGTAVGVIGVVVKPIVGFSDAFAHVMESVHDLAKDINVLEGKFRPNEKYRFPYVFGIERILIPFNKVDSISASLLRAHPIEKETDMKGNEVIVASEALQISSGLDQYIIVTTRRIVLFKVKVENGQGYVTVNLVWQVFLGEGAKITSSLDDRGHHSSILCISRFYTEDTSGNSMHFTFDDFDRNDPNAISLRSRGRIMFPRPETPRQVSGAPFRLRAWPFGTSEGVKVNRFVVEGEFKQRQNLLRIHNAICCLAGDFDSTIDEGYTTGKGEAVTRFGPLLFENQSNPPERANLAHLYKTLDHTAWECNAIDQESKPSWLDEGRLLQTFTPLLSTPTTSQSGVEQEELPVNSTDEVAGDMTNRKEVTSLTEGTAQSNPQHDSLLGAEPFNFNDLFVNDDGFENEQSTGELEVAGKSFSDRTEEGDFDQISRSDDIFKSTNSRVISEHDIVAEGGDYGEARSAVGACSLDAMSLQSWTPSPSTKREHQIEPASSGLDERLCRVEATLERLASSDVSVAFASTISKPSSLVCDSYSLGGQSANAYTSSSMSRTIPDCDSEIEHLQREILILRTQLNERKLETVVEDTTAQELSQQQNTLYTKSLYTKSKPKRALFRWKKRGSV